MNDDVAELIVQSRAKQPGSPQSQDAVKWVCQSDGCYFPPLPVKAPSEVAVQASAALMLKRPKRTDNCGGLSGVVQSVAPK
jgi:hypothetical protein